MAQYSLRFAADNARGERILTFYARSVGGALEIAKESAAGDWAELYEDGRAICRMELVSDTGVWLVGRTGSGL